MSKFTAQKIEQKLNIESSKIKIIYPGINTSIFNLYQDIEKQVQVRSKYDLPESYILYSGNLEPKKNILNLLTAFKLLKKSGIKQSLVISGQRNWRSQKVFDFIRNEFRAGDVTLTGYIDNSDIGDVYKLAKCLVLLSFCEGFGFPALEAFACGVPVAASHVGILQEINQAAYSLLESDNPFQIAQSLNRLLTDHNLRELQIKTGLTQVLKFSWHDCATKTLALYREVLEANG